ncbi:MAG: hypothetical protein FJZ92_04800 [Chloroflexi bacterium]|nr:hypothetical protein [Chloroflexota bacterium]
MREPGWFLDAGTASHVRAQFQRTCDARGWTLLAGAVIGDHVHVVVGVAGDPDPASLLRDLKRYTANALNERDGRERRRWTRSGWRRRLRGEGQVVAAIRYVRAQRWPLVVWVAPGWADEATRG